MRKFSFLLLFQFASAFWCRLAAQEPASVKMADGMRSEGKIYVVIAVILTILAGLLFYLVRLDKKIRQLEKENQ
jgi:hypothetical protein